MTYTLLPRTGDYVILRIQRGGYVLADIRIGLN